MYDFTIKGLFNANVKDVYNAFYHPELVSKWFGPNNLKVSSFISNFIEGGQYRVVLQSPDAFQQTVIGVYNTIEHEKELSFTWRWDDTNEMSKVSVIFSMQPNLTTFVKLSQSGFKTEQEMLQQQYGWMNSLEKLTLTMRNLRLTNQTLVA